MFRRIAQYVLIFFVIGIIMYLTVMNLDSTVKLSESFRNFLIVVGGSLGFDTTNEWWNTSANIRLLGHVIEYFVLGLVVGFVIKRKLVGLIMCMAISFADQIVKIYVPARHFDKGDIPFDVIGFCSGLAIAWVLIFAVKKMKERELNK